MSKPIRTAPPFSQDHTSDAPIPHPQPPQPKSPTGKRKPSPDSYRYVLTSGLAGGIAGCVAKTSVAPLDRVKILFQTRSPDYARYAGTWLGVFRAGKDIYAETGIRGLMQGHSATLLRIFPYAAIKYMAYDKIHIILMPTPESETSARRFLAGSSAGVISALITYPLELIRVRLAFEPTHEIGKRVGLVKIVKQIYAEPPLPLRKPPSSGTPSSSSPTTTTTTTVTAPPTTSTSTSTPTPAPTASSATRPSLTHFYRGIFPTLAGIIPYAGTSFLIWGLLKHDLLPSLLSPQFRRQHSSTLDLLAGGLAGAIGQTAAYPLDIVRRRMQVGPAVNGGGLKGRIGFVETARDVWKSAGWRGFFVGLSIGYLKVIPMNAVSFATWVGLKGVFGLETPERGD